ncbi:hypothetical protein FRB95_011966 [Tulasnella sp. JGI-2019a]|nr:hypothetical protein FRB95_011966 [Tulasnella sp. JGI-2019a]
MHSSIRRDIALIAVLTLLLYGLVEFRARTKLQYTQPSPILADSPENEAVGGLGDDYRDVAGGGKGAYPTSNPSALHYHKSSSYKSKHRNLGKVVGNLSSKEQHRLALLRRFPPTELIKHAPGFTILDNVYLYNGTLYIVRTDTFPNTFPEPRLMISNGAATGGSSSNSEPTDTDMQIINATQAIHMFGERAFRVQGTSFLSYDSAQLFANSFHEVLFSLWRTYASLDPRITEIGQTSLASPSRFILPHVSSKGWRNDHADMNQYVFRTGLPSTALEFDHTWVDRAETGRAFVFDRVVLGDRLAAGRGEDKDGWGTMLSQVDKIDGASKWWWEPVRRNVVGEGKTNERDVVITYVTRQASGGRRILKDEDHTRLVAGLRGLEKTYGWEVNVVVMENLKLEEKIALAARTTILMGVHGEGLTSLLWMRPSSKSTIMEFFAPEGISYDFQYPAKMLGIRHYGFWDKTAWTEPKVPRKSDFKHNGTPVGFSGMDIPIDADAVVKLCIERLIPPSAGPLTVDAAATP